MSAITSNNAPPSTILLSEAAEILGYTPAFARMMLGEENILRNPLGTTKGGLASLARVYVTAVDDLKKMQKIGTAKKRLALLESGLMDISESDYAEFLQAQEHVPEEA